MKLILQWYHRYEPANPPDKPWLEDVPEPLEENLIKVALRGLDDADEYDTEFLTASPGTGNRICCPEVCDYCVRIDEESFLLASKGGKEMTRDEMKNFIVESVVDIQGCKATELAAEIGHIIGHSLSDLVAELVAEARILEVEYTITGLNRLKSFLLPPDAEPKVVGTNQTDKDDDSH